MCRLLPCIRQISFEGVFTDIANINEVSFEADFRNPLAFKIDGVNRIKFGEDDLTNSKMTVPL